MKWIISANQSLFHMTQSQSHNSTRGDGECNSQCWGKCHRAHNFHWSWKFSSYHWELSRKTRTTKMLSSDDQQQEIWQQTGKPANYLSMELSHWVIDWPAIEVIFLFKVKCKQGLHTEHEHIAELNTLMVHQINRGCKISRTILLDSGKANCVKCSKTCLREWFSCLWANLRFLMSWKIAETRMRTWVLVGKSNSLQGLFRGSDLAEYFNAIRILATTAGTSNFLNPANHSKRHI